MKYLGLVMVLCGAACLAAAPDRVSAFEIQGESASLPGSPVEAQFNGLNQGYLRQDFKGSSLAMPFSGDTDSGNVSDYGNSISIPGPGIDQPAPAWAYRPSR